MVELKEVAENRLEHLKKAAARTEQAPAESEQQVAVDADGSEAVPASEKQDAAGDADESTVEAEIPAKSLATVRLAPLTSPPIVEKETSDNGKLIYLDVLYQIIY